MIATGRVDVIPARRAAHRSQYFEVLPLAMADKPSRDRRVGGVDHNPVVRPQLQVCLEEQVRCGRIDADHRKLPRVGIVGKNDQVRGWNDETLPPYEASDWKYNPITDSPVNYLLSDLQH